MSERRGGWRVNKAPAEGPPPDEEELTRCGNTLGGLRMNRAEQEALGKQREKPWKAKTPPIPTVAAGEP